MVLIIKSYTVGACINTGSDKSKQSCVAGNV